MIRVGLCIYSLQTKGRVNYHKRAAHFSLQDNIGFKIIKRGMPRLYEYNINQKYKKTNCIAFNEILMNQLEKLYETFKIPIINIKKIKIKSQIQFQISYDKDNNAWVVSDNLNNCVIFKEIGEVNELFRDKKINKFIHQICKECYEMFKNILKKKETKNGKINHNFLYEISKNTFLGFFIPDNNEIIFYSIVSNLPYNFEQFCLPLKEVEDIYMKFGLPYEKAITLKTDLVTFPQISKELKYIYRRISEDYASFQSIGAIVLIENDNEIITGFKILNQEMKIIKKMKMIKFNLGRNKNGKNNNNINNNNLNNNTIKEEDENNNLIINSNRIDNKDLINSSKLNEFVHELSHYQLPRCVHIYSKLFMDIDEDYTTSKCLEKLEELSKSTLEKCNCNKEKNNVIYSINLLSCLIPMSQIKNFNSVKSNNIIMNNSRDLDQSLRSQTFAYNSNGKNHINYGYNKNPTFKVHNYLFDRKQIAFNTKKPKKKVKFVDEVYNKSLTEEILIKSYKKYNNRNNYLSSTDSFINCRVCKKTACCNIF
jgi:hypothetical protein